MYRKILTQGTKFCSGTTGWDNPASLCHWFACLTFMAYLPNMIVADVAGLQEGELQMTTREAEVAKAERDS